MKKIWMVGMLVACLSACQDEAPAANVPPTASEVEAVIEAPAPLDWNMADSDATTNGNIAVAVARLASGEELQQVKAAPGDLLKRPWEYYGKKVCVPIEVEIAEDMPPESEEAKNFGGAVGEVVGSADTGEILDIFVMGGTGRIEKGTRINACGLVTGRTEVPNRIGGNFTHLIMVAKIKQP